MADRVEEKARERLEDYGVEVELDPKGRGGSRPARVWHLRAGERTILVMATRLLGSEWPSTKRGGSGQPEAEELPLLWYADYITAKHAAYLRATGQHYIDTVGNVHLHLPPFVLEVQGKMPTRRPHAARKRPTEVRVWRGPALRLLFQLLCDPALAERPQREVARITGCAPGTVMHLYRDLQVLGNLVPISDKRRRFVPDQALRDRWIVEFGQKLRPKLLLGNFEVAHQERWKSFHPANHEALWGAESAARRLGADLDPGVQTLYVPRIRAGLLKASGLRASDRGPVELRQVFWNIPAPESHSRIHSADREDTPLVPALLVAADLMATRDGRCQAAARFILTHHLDGLLQEP